jgi:hypothetical protein
MKPKRILIIIMGTVIMLCMLQFSMGQQTKGFNYQAVARNAGGAVMAKADLAVRIGILNQENGETLWLEEHQVTTSDYGIFNLTIGANPSLKIGGSMEQFEQINWQEGSYSMHVQVKEQLGEFVDLGDSPILPVPYAMVSERVTQPLNQFTIQNTGDLPTDAALFEVRRADGRPVFSVYEDGVWVYTDTSDSKGTKGGFAVGGYRRTKGDMGETYMRVTPDSVRIYINDDPAKGTKGGFAVGGYRRSTKADNEDYMSVFSDSIRFHVGYNPGKGRAGGFAISGASHATGQPTTYLFLTPENYFIGDRSGINNTTGLYNTVFGYRAGEFNTEGKQNVMIGYAAGNQNTIGEKNVFIGDSAGYFNTEGTWNVFMGRSSGLNNITGKGNVFIGSSAGEQNTSGRGNIFLGSMTGRNNMEGMHNCYIGQYSGYSADATANVFLGYYTGTYHHEGNDNIFIGKGAGWQNLSGTGNVYIGRRSGMRSDTSSFNVALGFEAGMNLMKGEMNVLIGTGSGKSIVEAYNNTFIGHSSGFSNLHGNDNTCLGGDAGRNNTDGHANVFIGLGAGETNMGSSNVYLGTRAGQESQGSGNVFIGTHAGRYVIDSDLLVIENSDLGVDQSLIVGRFDQDELRMNAIVGINTEPDPAFSLRTVGDIEANDVTIVSDARYKTNIRSIPEALDMILTVKGIKYEWDLEAFPDMEFDEGDHYGFIAQELEKIIPEMVSAGTDGYKSVNYQKMNALLVEAVKQQQVMIEEKEKRIRDLEERMKKIETALFD